MDTPTIEHGLAKLDMEARTMVFGRRSRTDQCRQGRRHGPLRRRAAGWPADRHRHRARALAAGGIRPWSTRGPRWHWSRGIQQLGQCRHRRLQCRGRGSDLGLQRGHRRRLRLVVHLACLQRLQSGLLFLQLLLQLGDLLPQLRLGRRAARAGTAATGGPGTSLAHSRWRRCAWEVAAAEVSPLTGDCALAEAPACAATWG